ncbi:hypothetical protein ACFWOG_32890 [Kitasatospora sp. NPDC058406]|uniref:hypothetical protein n=1 Tax=Kitasatospora sp. NPDC058406 TaxID=3346483 RepID=UPI003666FD14
MERHVTEGPPQVMTCGECRQLASWNPTSFCSWDCYDTRPRDPDSVPSALSHFLGLGRSAPLKHPRNP